MYDQFFNFLGLREDPFHVSPDPRYFYHTPSHEAALAELLYGIETRKGFMVLTGEAGTGKTSLLKQILDWLKGRRRSTAYIFHTHVEPIGLLKLILTDFGAPCYSRSKSELVSALHTWLLRRHAAGDLPVLILDEAQALPMQTLDELRLLLNLETSRGKLLQIILAGQPELENKLRLPELRQLRQRIVFHSRLDLLSQKETAAYISRRLAVAGCPDSLLFPDEVVQDIYVSSRGIPRVVNLLCEHALISAYAERQHVVSPEMIQRVAEDFDLVERPLAVPESELEAQYARASRFPLMEASESSNALDRDSLRWLEQIEFDVSKTPVAPASLWPLPGTPAKPAPEPTFRAAVETPKPLERPTGSPVARSSGAIRRYWRGHRSVASRFLRNSVGSLRRAGHAIMTSFDAAKVRLAALFKSAKKAIQEYPAPQTTPKPSMESPKPVERPKQTTIASSFRAPRGYWRSHRSLFSRFMRDTSDSVRRAWRAVTASFDVVKVRLAARFKSTKPLVKVNAVPQVVSKVCLASQKPVERPTQTAGAHRSSATHRHWRNVRAFGGKSIASIRRGCHAACDSLLGYARPVLHSFIRDCQSLFHIVAPPTPALEVGAPTAASHGASTNRRVLSPVLNWFRQPMTVRRVSSHRSAASPSRASQPARAKAQACGSRDAR